MNFQSVQYSVRPLGLTAQSSHLSELGVQAGRGAWFKSPTGRVCSGWDALHAKPPQSPLQSKYCGSLVKEDTAGMFISRFVRKEQPESGPESRLADPVSADARHRADLADSLHVGGHGGIL